MRILTLLIIFSSHQFFIKDKPPTDNILQEGQLLYRLEKASWYGTDYLFIKYSQLRDSVGGYLSYVTENRKIVTIFFSKQDHDRIIIRFRFDSLPKPEPVFVDEINKIATSDEKNLITIRQDALLKIQTDKNNFFKSYKNTSFNVIPIITSNERKVYILTAPTKLGEILLGNDYLLNYDNLNNLALKIRIHISLVALPLICSKKDGNPTLETMHSHINSDYIDPTDICTLLLYKDFVEWKTHYIISKNFVSVFDLRKETLVILPKKEWEKKSRKNDIK